MIKNLKFENFLLENNISPKDWKSSNLNWDLIHAIGIDHESRMDELQETAEFYAKLIQKCTKVHSVRWRVKDATHLMEKIFRKKYKDSDKKYQEISIDNYHEIVTDLIGVRGLYLFKDDCFEIDAYLRRNWNTVETPVAYIRQGDCDILIERYTKSGLEIKEHPAGHRSINYVFESQPVKRKILAEIQVRTFFEEGWSEIDHEIRCPNFSGNQLVLHFLKILNRLSENADEMGALVKELVEALGNHTIDPKTSTQDKNKKINQIEDILLSFEGLNKQDIDSKQIIQRLKIEASSQIANKAQDSTCATAASNSLTKKFIAQLEKLHEINGGFYVAPPLKPLDS